MPKWRKDNPEKGVIKKDPSGKLKVCLIYPNHYYTGMSNLGFRIVYSLFNSDPDTVCERMFYQDNNRYLSIESGIGLDRFDIVAFSASFENDFPNIARILYHSGIPPMSSDRGKSHPLLILGGAVTLINPEPVADFFDIICVGEAELLIPTILDVYKRCRDIRPLLSELSCIEGFYIPRFYREEYSGTAGFLDKIPLAKARATITPARIDDLNSLSFFPQLLTRNTEFSGMYLLEAQRSCPWSCRFCAVSTIYRSNRNRGLESITKELDAASIYAGRIGIIGPSLSEYPGIIDLLTEYKDIELSITSLRISKRAIDMVKLLNKKSVSIAPETASEQMRFSLNKKITNIEIIETASEMLRHGVETLRMYFMIGLPGEEDGDVRAIVDMAEAILASSPDARIVPSVSIFVPKPHTPLQGSTMADPSIIRRRLKILKAGSSERISIKSESPDAAYMQGLFARGDRRLSRVIVNMINSTDWKKACTVAKIDSDMFLFNIRDNNHNPWDFLSEK